MEHCNWTPFFLPFSIFLISSIIWLLFFKKNGNSSLSSFRSRTRLFHLLFAGGFFQEISSILHRLRDRYGPVITVGAGPLSITWVIDRHIAHKALVQEGGVFSDRIPVQKGGVFIMIYSKWRVIGGARGKLWGVLRRNLLTKALHKSNLRAFAGRRRLAVEQLVVDLQAQRQEFMFASIFHRALFRLIVCMCFGEDLDLTVVRSKFENDHIIPLGLKLCISTNMPSVTKFMFWRTWRRFLQGRRRFEEIVIPFIDAQRERLAKELPQRCNADVAVSYMDTLLDLEIPDQEEGRTRKLREKEIASLCQEFLVLGVDSTVCALEWIMANLVIHPHIQQKLYEEIVGVAPPGQEIQQDELAKMPYLKAVILETLRLHPPITIPFPRVVPKQACIDGHTVDKGRIVLFDMMGIGRDEAIWEEPSEFKPERFLEGGEGEGVDITGSREIKMVPFGAGRRLCPGIGLAMINLEYFLACLVREFKWEAAHHGREIDMTTRIDIIGGMKNPLCVRISPRQ